MSRPNAKGGFIAAFGSTLFITSSFAQSPFATRIENVVQGTGPGIIQPNNVLGGPQGGGVQFGSLHVHSLGTSGSITLGFDVRLRNGPGADFTVFENGFGFSGGIFAEVVAVDVSTNGVDWATFPTSYAGPQGPLPAFGTSPMGTYSGLAGGMPVAANVASNTIDPLDPVVSGGDSFDLDELRTHPLVLSGSIDLDDIRYVRLQDVAEGTLADRQGRWIWDHGGATGSADIDAIAVLQSDATHSADQPTCDLSLDAQGYVHWHLLDPNGFFDLDLRTLHASLDLQPFPLDLLLPSFSLVSLTSEGLHLRSLVPISGTGLLGTFAVSVRDLAGHFSGDQLMLQG